MKRTKRYFRLSLVSTLLIIAMVFSLLSYDTTTSKAEEYKFMRYYDGNEILYINIDAGMNDWWINECVHRVYFFGQDNAWGTLEKLGNTNIYKVIVPQGQYNKLIICRCNDNNSTFETNGVYNQTGDIDIIGDYDYICTFNGEHSTIAGWAYYDEVGKPFVEYSMNVATQTTGNNSNTTIQKNDVTVTKNLSNTNGMQGGTILHAFNWTFKDIKENLATIKYSGYTAVQTSPIQPPKDYDKSYQDTKNQWWKLYQPLGYTIGNESWLGTKQDLIDLCKEADKHGIKIICDIVANHLASDGGQYSINLHKDVEKYEPTISNAPLGTYTRNFNTAADNNSVAGNVYNYIGAPDVITSNKYIQERVISLLKECIDCGVDGFRFDAVKHIETPDDGEYSSDFWPTVTTAAKKYGKSKGEDIFIYGEALSPLAYGRSYSSYAKYMSITDNSTSDQTLYAIETGNVNLAKSSNYYTGVDASKLVLWAESHDTYIHQEANEHPRACDAWGGTNVLSENQINKAYAIVASRANATSLYLSRPGETMGSHPSSAWKGMEVQAINAFHNTFYEANEYLSSHSNIILNERYSNNSNSNMKYGAVLVNLNENNQSYVENVKVNTLPDGTYIDNLTHKPFIVKNGYLSGNIGNTGIAILYKSNAIVY